MGPFSRTAAKLLLKMKKTRRTSRTRSSRSHRMSQPWHPSMQSRWRRLVWRTHEGLCLPHQGVLLWVWTQGLRWLLRAMGKNMKGIQLLACLQQALYVYVSCDVFCLPFFPCASIHCVTCAKQKTNIFIFVSGCWRHGGSADLPHGRGGGDGGAAAKASAGRAQAGGKAAVPWSDLTVFI